MGTVSIEKREVESLLGCWTWFVVPGQIGEAGFMLVTRQMSPGRVCVVDLRYGGAQGIF